MDSIGYGAENKRAFVPIEGFYRKSTQCPTVGGVDEQGIKYQLRPNRRTRGQQCRKKHERQGFGI